MILYFFYMIFPHCEFSLSFHHTGCPTPIVMKIFGYFYSSNGLECCQRRHLNLLLSFGFFVCLQRKIWLFLSKFSISHLLYFFKTLWSYILRSVKFPTSYHFDLCTPRVTIITVQSFKHWNSTIIEKISHSTTKNIFYCYWL